MEENNVQVDVLPDTLRIFHELDCKRNSQGQLVSLTGFVYR